MPIPNTTNITNSDPNLLDLLPDSDTRDQCVFLRGFHFRLKKSLFGKEKGLLHPGLSNPPDSNSADNAHGISSLGGGAGTAGAQNPQGSSGASGTSVFQQRSLGLSEVLEETADCQSELKFESHRVQLTPLNIKDLLK